jgi:hypothetical protein
LSATTETPSTRINPRDERRRILKTDNYNRMGFKDQKEGVSGQMIAEYTSPLLAEMRANGVRQSVVYVPYIDECLDE